MGWVPCDWHGGFAGLLIEQVIDVRKITIKAERLDDYTPIL